MSLRVQGAKEIDLLRIGPPNTAAALDHCIRSSTAASAPQLACIRASGELAGSMSLLVPTLQKLVTDPNEDVRKEAAFALLRVDRPLLEELLPTISRQDPALEKSLREKIKLSTL
jgi:hypothetical protein